MEEEDTKADHWKNVIVMSDAGKPIFWRFGNDEEILTTCGLISALMASASGLGDMQYLRSKSLSLVFMTVGAISLVAIAKKNSSEDEEGEQLLMKLQLEYLYGQIIFTLTQQVQTILIQNPNYDIGQIIGASETVMRGMLNDSGAEGERVASYLTGAIEVVGPIAKDLREKTSLTLLGICNETPNTVFAILLVGEKLLSLVQPSYLPHQLHPSDLRILIKFITCQPGLFTSCELWSPICLPRFNASGFLYAYSSCLHERTKLSLVLVSQMNETTQFDLFRQASTKIRKELGLPLAVGSVLKIGVDERTNDTDVAWKRLDDDSSVDGDSADASKVRTSSRGVANAHQDPLLSEILDAIDLENFSELVDEYMGIGKVLHFVFRKDVQVSGHTNKECGQLPQCFSPPLDFADAKSKRRVWSIYQKLCLRMRLGSATTEVTWDGYNEMLEANLSGVDHETDVPLIHPSSSAVAQALTESIPKTNGITYMVDGKELFLAMNGKGFELYAVFSASILITQATSSAALLARTLVADSGKLFLMEPLTWKD